jgi:hypothetical protein
MITVSRGAGWKHYWGQMPLPAGAEALGTISRETGAGALIKLASGAYVQGNAGSIRTLPQREVEQALAASITPHKGGRTEIVSPARVTPETKAKLQTILERRGMSYADWLSEMVESEFAE